MPTDKSGKYHNNTQLAMAADKAPAKTPKAPSQQAGDPVSREMKNTAADVGGGNSTTLHDHGDGSFHTEGPAGKTEHSHIGHAFMHMAANHSDGKHSHSHEHGGGTTAHSMEHGEVSGPHEQGGQAEGPMMGGGMTGLE